MRLQERDVPRGGLANPALPLPLRPFAAIANFIDMTFVIAELEVRKLRHDPTELVTRAIQPMLWLLVFGQVFTRTRAIPTGDMRYLDFMAPGILAQSVLFIAGRMQVRAPPISPLQGGRGYDEGARSLYHAPATS